MLSKLTILHLLLLCLNIDRIFANSNAKDKANTKINTEVTLLQSPINAVNARNNNSSLLDVHVRLFHDLLERQATEIATSSPQVVSQQRIDVVQEFVNILWKTANITEWTQMLETLITFAANTPNLTAKYVTYEALWRKLQTMNLRYNSSNVLALYRELQLTIQHINSTATNNTIVPVEFSELQSTIRESVITRSAQLLEAPLYVAQVYGSNNSTQNCTQFPAVERLLVELHRLPESVFDETLNTLFDAVEQLESNENIAKALLCLGGSVSQRLRANIKYETRLPKDTVSREVIALLQRNIQELVRHADLGQLPAAMLTHIQSYLPRSLRALRDSNAICIRNASGYGDNYLYECTQTFLMCTHEALNQYRASYRVERLLGHKFIFRSNYWSARYIKLEESGSNVIATVNATVPAFIKNVYSDLREGVWQAVFVGDLVAFLDVDMRFYLCGGNPSMWSGSEHHVYTRRAQDFQLYRQECLWLIEDCSNSM